jgi:hypothetical protein
MSESMVERDWHNLSTEELADQTIRKGASMTTELDVIEVQIKAPHTVRVIARNKDEQNAEAIIKMAVFRRGVKDAFFKTAPTGKYRDGDTLMNLRGRV